MEKYIFNRKYIKLDLNLISYKIEQITINYLLYYSQYEYKEVEVGEPKINKF